MSTFRPPGIGEKPVSFVDNDYIEARGRSREQSICPPPASSPSAASPLSISPSNNTNGVIINNIASSTSFRAPNIRRNIPSTGGIDTISESERNNFNVLNTCDEDEDTDDEITTNSQNHPNITDLPPLVQSTPTSPTSTHTRLHVNVRAKAVAPDYSQCSRIARVYVDKSHYVTLHCKPNTTYNELKQATLNKLRGTIDDGTGVSRRQSISVNHHPNHNSLVNDIQELNLDLDNWISRARGYTESVTPIPDVNRRNSLVGGMTSVYNSTSTSMNRSSISYISGMKIEPMDDDLYTLIPRGFKGDLNEWMHASLNLAVTVSTLHNANMTDGNIPTSPATLESITVSSEYPVLSQYSQYGYNRFPTQSMPFVLEFDMKLITDLDDDVIADVDVVDDHAGEHKGVSSGSPTVSTPTTTTTTTTPNNNNNNCVNTVVSPRYSPLPLPPIPRYPRPLAQELQVRKVNRIGRRLPRILRISDTTLSNTVVNEDGGVGRTTFTCAVQDVVAAHCVKNDLFMLTFAFRTPQIYQVPNAIDVVCLITKHLHLARCRAKRIGCIDRQWQLVKTIPMLMSGKRNSLIVPIAIDVVKSAEDEIHDQSPKSRRSSTAMTTTNTPVDQIFAHLVDEAVSEKLKTIEDDELLVPLRRQQLLTSNTLKISHIINDNINRVQQQQQGHVDVDDDDNTNTSTDLSICEITIGAPTSPSTSTPTLPSTSSQPPTPDPTESMSPVGICNCVGRGKLDEMLGTTSDIRLQLVVDKVLYDITTPEGIAINKLYTGEKFWIDKVDKEWVDRRQQWCITIALSPNHLDLITATLKTMKDAPVSPELRKCLNEGNAITQTVCSFIEALHNHLSTKYWDTLLEIDSHSHTHTRPQSTLQSSTSALSSSSSNICLNVGSGHMTLCNEDPHERDQRLKSVILQSVELAVLVPIRVRLDCYFNIAYREQDMLLFSQCVRMIGLKQHFFGIREDLQSPDKWSLAVHCLSQLQTGQTAFERLNCLLDTARYIYFTHKTHATLQRNQSIIMHQSDGIKIKPISPLSADDFFPIFVFVVVQSRLPNLESLKQYMVQLCTCGSLQGESGYYLTVFEAALEYIATLNIPDHVTD